MKRYAAAAVLLALSACSRTPVPPAANVVLITIDTLRADHLECYGYASIRTPGINALAADGALFRHAIAQVPLTLPSHCSILTGTYPNATGVRDQAGFTLAPDRTTLAELLKPAGFDTAAFVASAVLAPEYGLNQGFDVYAAPTRVAEVERRGDAVLDDALRWIQAPGRKRFFAWIHFFDPHAPYAPPEPYRSQYAPRLYDGEIAFTDSQIEKLSAALKATGHYDKTVIVLTGDHGESLGEHGEETHGLLLYDATLHVPLIVKPANQRPKNRMIAGQVRGIDIVPTILDLLSLPIPPHVQGQSLVPLLNGSRASPVLSAFAETYFPLYHFQWSPLVAVRTGTYKYIQAPHPELYDLKSDPGESRNVLQDFPRTAAEMQDQVQKAYVRSAAASAQPSPSTASTMRKLQSLGYIGAPAAAGVVSFDRLPDPKDKIRVYTLLQHAIEDAEQGRLQNSMVKLKQVLREDSKILDAHLNLGVDYAQSGRFAESVAPFRRVLEIDPRNVIARVNLGLSYANLGRMAEAAGEFTRTVELDPRNAEAWMHLGRIRQLDGQTDAAVEAYRKALDLDPGLGRAHAYLAEAYRAKGMPQAAAEEGREAQRLSSK